MIQPLRSSLVWLLVMCAGLFGVTVLAWLLGADPLAAGNWSGRASEAIHPWRVVLMVARWALWCLLWCRWMWIGEYVFRGESDKAQAQRCQWQRLRIRLVSGIASVEGLILFSYLKGA